jgi:DNA-binding transcriptional MerR regulator
VTEPQTYSMEELAAQTGIKERNIRFYIAEGLLHPPAERGRYDERHLIRLRFIRKLTEEYVRLDQIRRQLERYSDEEILTLLNQQALPAPPEQRQIPAPSRREDLMDYLRQAQGHAVPLSQPMSEQTRHSRHAQMSHSPTVDRSDWERWTLRDGVELHVRKPLSPEQQRLIDALLNWIQTQP